MHWKGLFCTSSWKRHLGALRRATGKYSRGIVDQASPVLAFPVGQPLGWFTRLARAAVRVSKLPYAGDVHRPDVTPTHTLRPLIFNARSWPEAAGPLWSARPEEADVRAIEHGITALSLICRCSPAWRAGPQEDHSRRRARTVRLGASLTLAFVGAARCVGVPGQSEP